MQSGRHDELGLQVTWEIFIADVACLLAWPNNKQRWQEPKSSFHKQVKESVRLCFAQLLLFYKSPKEQP
jgi:hypothetical protein